MKTLMLLEDQLLLRETWKIMLEGNSNYQVIAEAADVTTALDKLKTYQPDILLCDIFLLNETSLPVIAQLKAVAPKTKTLVLSSTEEPAYVELLLKKGAYGFISKNCSRQEMLEALNAASSGSVYLSSHVRVHMFEKERKTVELTGREFDTLILLTRRLTNAQIAEKLNRGLKTIEAIKTSLYKKTGAYNAGELLAIARKNALDLEDDYIIRRKTIYC
jgi:two-component system invasion response regulator UvrY